MTKKLTPVLFVPEIEAVLPLWVDRLGFSKTAEVPDGGKLAFVILHKNGVEVMYQSFASLAKDVPALEAAARSGRTFLYIEVESLDAIKKAIHGFEVYMPERTTFYGSKEIGIKDPAGHFLTFAEFGAPAQS